MKRTVTLLVCLACLVAAIVVVAHTRLSTDMSAFLPGSPTPQQQILVDQLHDGAINHILFLGITDAPPDQLATLSKNLSQHLRHEPEFTGISNGEKEAFTADRDFLFKNRYLLSAAVTPEHFSVDSLHAALLHDLDLLRSNMSGMVGPMLAADPAGEMIGMITAMGTNNSHPATRAGIWLSQDNQRAVMLVQTRAGGFDIDTQQKGLEAIDRDFAAAKAETGITSAQLLETGPGVFAVHSRDTMKRDATRFSIIATMLVAAILLAVYRSPRILILALLPVASGALAGMAIVSLGFGYVHGITLGFGVTLIGEAVDYAIYLFTQTPPGTAPEKTLPRIWPTLLLGMLTSVVGFSAMLFSSFSGFAQLGLFTIAGLVAALCVTRFVLPLLLPHGFATTTSLLPIMSRTLDRLAGLKSLPFIFVAAALLIFAMHQGSFWENDITSMSPLPAQVRALDKQLRADTGASSMGYLLALTAPTQEAVLQQSEALDASLHSAVQDKALDAYDSPAHFLPSVAAQTTRQAALPTTDILQGNLAQAAIGLPFKSDLFQPFLADVAAAKTQALITRATLDGTNLALKTDALLSPHGDIWRAVLPLYGVHDPARLEAIAKNAGGIVLDLKRQSNDLLRAYRREAIILSLVGSAAIVVLLFISLRSPIRVTRVILPLALAVLVTSALFTLGDHKLSIFTLFGLLLTIAIGSNYCLFFERQKLDPAHHERTAASLGIANLCTVIGFGILSFSGIPVLHGIGGTVAVGAVLSLLFAAMLIPERRAP